MELLQELLRRNGITQGPKTQIHADTLRESKIAIGADNTARIQLHVEDVDALGSLLQPIDYVR